MHWIIIGFVKRKPGLNLIFFNTHLPRRPFTLQFYIQLVYRAILPFYTNTSKKFQPVMYLQPKWIFFLTQRFSADATKCRNFSKAEKFSLLPWLPIHWNSWSQKWLIDQLYIKLGLLPNILFYFLPTCFLILKIVFCSKIHNLF